MKRFSTAILALVMPLVMVAQGWPANYGGVMLQGFFWDSFVDTQWTNLESESDEVAEYFDLLWVPQSGNCNTSYNVMGYAPVYWYDQNSTFGTEEQLRSMIQAYKQKGVGVIADVVINHRGSVGVGGSWVDFPAETYKGVTYQMGLADICKNDDGGNTAKTYDVTGANDTGEDWGGMRDLDHTSQNVQDNVVAYLNFLQDDLGYAGFRYDMTKGYAAKYTALYNSTVGAAFSVGEYWDGNVTALKNWLNNTKVDGVIQSATFDFTTRYSVRDACNGNNWSKLANRGLAGDKAYRRYAVTFIENHDTQYRSATEQNDPIKNYVEAGNAFILSMPGTPCVFLTHWKEYRDEIKQLITLRKLVGVTNQSGYAERNNSASLYAAEVTGENGKLIVACGNGAYVPSSDFTLAVSGNAYKVYASNSLETPWVSVPSGEVEKAFDVTLTALSTDATARLVYTLDGSEPTASSASVASGGSVAIASTCTLKVGLLSGGRVKSVVTRNYRVVPFVPHTVTVHVKDPGWAEMHFYAWANDGGNTQLNGGWPGNVVTDTKMVNGEKWYYKTFDITSKDYSFNIIFDKGSSSDQTVDIGPISEDKFYILSADKTNGKYTVTDVTEATGIHAPAADAARQNLPVQVYSLGGQLLRVYPSGTPVDAALQQLPAGLYIVNGQKVVK
ncbi:MAG: starch-binding protein [Bacteroidaceae bacterium]|nr:starch-binding protein [Bacteroidaceae bacterium]